jgi:uncharacterized protein with HEPN domain
MLDAIATIQLIVADRTFDEYSTSPEFRGAVERYVLLISEACRHLPAELVGRRPEIAWRRIADIGNVIRHEYDRLDDRIIWEIVQNRLVEVRDALEFLLDQQEG